MSESQEGLIELFRSMEQALVEAQRDPRRQSRWWFRRARAERAYWQLSDGSRAFADNRRTELIAEAISRVEATAEPEQPTWWRPDIKHVMSGLDGIWGISDRVVLEQRSSRSLPATLLAGTPSGSWDHT